MDELDIFETEQRIFDEAVKRENADDAYKALTKEYGRLLKQLRRTTRLADRTTANLNESNEDLNDKIHYDVMTGIYNRRFMDDNLARIIRSLAREGGVLSVLMVDVDFFKRYNDTYGHSKGDDCLKVIASALSEGLMRANDFAARYGGEEFVVVLPGTDESEARVIANRLLENVREKNIPHEKNDAAPCVTISIGVTTAEVERTQTGVDYIKRADEALYLSKQNGRNCYTFISF